MTTTLDAQRAERFGQFFRVSPALDAATLDEVHRIRHEVYARDLGYEAIQPDGRERDAHDRHAMHCIVRTARDSRAVGCARLVLPNPHDAAQPLPFETTCRDALDRSLIDPRTLPRDRIAEVSRLAVMGEFRRRRGEQSQPVSISADDCEGQPVPRFPNIPVSLYIAAVVMAQRRGVEYLFTLTEPRLARHFSLMGVQVHAIGSPVEHRGLRVPSLIRVSEVYPSLRALIRPIWHEVHAQMSTGYLVHEARQPSRSETLLAA